MYTEKFKKAVDYVLANEGGYVFDKNDPGGETKWGISKRTYPSLNIKALSLDEAKKIYYCDYWLKGKFEEIRDERVAIKLFDLAINVGITQANRIIQRALRSTGNNVKDDGILGPISLKAINSSNANLLICALCSEAAGYYRLLAAINTNMKQFLNGWLNRSYKSVLV